MSATGKASGIKVRGSCRNGHVTEATSNPGRLTWEGPCSHEGCDLNLRAKRIPRDEVPAPLPAGADAGSTTRVVRITDYDATAGPDDAGGLVVADIAPEPAREPEHRPTDDTGSNRGPARGAGPADPIDPAPHGRPRLSERLRARRNAGARAEAVRSARRQPRHPLGIF